MFQAAMGKGRFIRDPGCFGDQQQRMARVGALKGSWGHIVKSFTFLTSQGLKAARSSREFCAGVWGAMEETVKIGELGLDAERYGGQVHCKLLWRLTSFCGRMGEAVSVHPQSDADISTSHYCSWDKQAIRGVSW